MQSERFQFSVSRHVIFLDGYMDAVGRHQRGRLGFYLIDYICWFKEFTRGAECFKLDCEPLSSATLGQAVYLLQLESDQRVLLLFQRIDKARRAAAERTM